MCNPKKFKPFSHWPRIRQNNPPIQPLHSTTPVPSFPCFLAEEALSLGTSAVVNQST